LEFKYDEERLIDLINDEYLKLLQNIYFFKPSELYLNMWKVIVHLLLHPYLISDGIGFPCCESYCHQTKKLLKKSLKETYAYFLKKWNHIFNI
jgi:hypothetical protein